MQVGITEEYVEIWGSGEVYREFLYVDDMADGCVFLMENVNADQLKMIVSDYFVNLGTGEDIKIKDLALIIKNNVGFEGDIKYDISKPDGTKKKLLYILKLKGLGWQPKIRLDDGIINAYYSYFNSYRGLW